MRPARRVVPPNVIAIVANRTRLGARAKDGRMKNEARTLRLKRHAVLVRELLESRDQPPAERLQACRMARAEGVDFIEAPAAGGQAERVGVEGARMHHFAAEDRLEDARDRPWRRTGHLRRSPSPGS